jgi:hypothetical protein
MIDADCPPEATIGPEVVTAALADPQTATATGDLRVLLDTIAVMFDGAYGAHPRLLVRYEKPGDGTNARLA